MAEDFGSCTDEDGWKLLKGFPLRRSKRRTLLQSDRWLVHLCAGTPRSDDPIRQWCDANGVTPVYVDLLAPGGKGWDLTKKGGVWRALLWAAASGRIVGVLSSPPRVPKPGKEILYYQDQVLWSVASVARGSGIPYVREVAAETWKEYSPFMDWSGTKTVIFNQAGLEGGHLRRTCLVSNLDLSFLPRLGGEGADVAQVPIWSAGLRKELVNALSGRPTGPTCDELDRVIRTATYPEERALEQGFYDDLDDERLNAMFEQESVFSSSEDEEVEDRTDVGLPSFGSNDGSGSFQPQIKGVKEFSGAAIEGWRQHLLNGHTPYRRDCKQCVEGAGLGPFHYKVKHPKLFALSIDLFGPVPIAEAGRDESCVTGKCTLRYGLVGALRIPKSMLSDGQGTGRSDKTHGVEDLADTLPADALCDEYQPSEPGEGLFPELFEDELLPAVEKEMHSFVVDAVEVQKECASLLEEPEEVSHDKEVLQDLIQELSSPVEQVVLRYFIPIKTKTGAEVTEAVQRMILDISQTYPIRHLHHDPGTEFSSTTLSRWLTERGISVTHSLPTDKKGNGLAERTVGWLKSRIRTLLKGASLPTHWWPLAGRWAAHKHNIEVLGLPRPPAFAQPVLPPMGRNS